MGISSYGGLAYWVYQAMVVWRIGYSKLWWSSILGITSFYSWLVFFQTNFSQFAKDNEVVLKMLFPFDIVGE